MNVNMRPISEYDLVLSVLFICNDLHEYISDNTPILYLLYIDTFLHVTVDFLRNMCSILNYMELYIYDGDI